MNYNFKGILNVPSAKDLVNVTLSKTQRKTPTVVHPKYAITRIRGFYMRKVKFTSENIHEKLSEILDSFPKLDDIHPFFADLINVIYDKDHYKLALGHIHTARNIVDNIAKDYVRFLKYGDSLYRCKMLKRAALGRMVTVIRKLGATLSFLDEVRKHLARMPSIDPTTRTLLIVGFPNAGKSSFINAITNANVETQPYPFTTQSLYVGHTDYDYLPWQVIDTPGILDTPLEQRTTIEMQSITAMAHLKACVLYFIDISETGGYSLDQQISLCNNIKPLFAKKPLLFVLTKIDLRKFEELEPAQQEKLRQLAQENNTTLVTLSNKSKEGIFEVKDTACKLLSDFRKNQSTDNIPSKIIKREEEFAKGIYVAKPKAPRDKKHRPAVIPEEILLEGRKRLDDKPTLKEIQEAMGGAGVFNFPLQEHYKLEDPNWKYDIMPEIMDGKNVWDFYDKDLPDRLKKIEDEEDMLMLGKGMEEEAPELEKDLFKAYQEVKSKKVLAKIEHKMKAQNRVPRGGNVPLVEVKEGLAKVGKSVEPIKERLKGKRKGTRLEDLYKDTMDAMEVEDEDEGRRLDRRMESKQRAMSRSRSKGTKPEMNERDINMDRLKRKIQKEWKTTISGEADRRVDIKMPKHLYTGKRGMGKTDRR